MWFNRYAHRHLVQPSAFLNAWHASIRLATMSWKALFLFTQPVVGPVGTGIYLSSTTSRMPVAVLGKEESLLCRRHSLSGSTSLLSTLGRSVTYTTCIVAHFLSSKAPSSRRIGTGSLLNRPNLRRSHLRNSFVPRTFPAPQANLRCLSNLKNHSNAPNSYIFSMS